MVEFRVHITIVFDQKFTGFGEREWRLLPACWQMTPEKQREGRLMAKLFRTSTQVPALLTLALAAVLFLPAMSTAQSAADALAAEIAKADSIVVVPNPYNISGRLFGAQANPSGYERIRFQGIPGDEATIKVYTAAGNHVITLNYTKTRVDYAIIGFAADGAFNWSGRNANNQYVSSGLYVYVVEMPPRQQNTSAGVVDVPALTKVGKFIVIR